MILETPPGTDILNASATSTTSGMITVPDGRWFTGNIQLSATQSGAGTATPSVTWTGSGTNFAPASGSTVARIMVGGVLGVINGDTDTMEILVYGGDAGSTGGTLNFTASGTSSSCVINGFLI